jgi:hypothetical protein
MLIFGQDDRVTAWVAGQEGNVVPPPAYASIGYERGGKLVAGVFFDGVTETNVFAHIASTSHVLPRSLLTATCEYAYGQCGAQRLTLMIRDDNRRCIDMVLGMGAKLECVITYGHESGDVLLFVLWKDAKFVERLRARHWLKESLHG